MSIFSKLFGKEETDKADQISQDTQKIADIIGCPFEIVDLNSSAEQIMALYEKEYEEGRANGYTPIILITSEILFESIECNYNNNGNAEEYRKRLLSGSHENGSNVLKERFNTNMECFEEFNGEDVEIYGDFDDSVKPQNTFSGVITKDRDKGEQLLLVKIPTTRPWEIFAWIPFGGWNECPDEDDMMAVCKYWYDKHGAVPAVISRDTLQLYCTNPVRDRNSALKLAEEQYGFCNDIVDQGIGMIKSLASSLINSKIWYFWWD